MISVVGLELALALAATTLLVGLIAGAMVRRRARPEAQSQPRTAQSTAEKPGTSERGTDERGSSASGTLEPRRDALREPPKSALSASSSGLHPRPRRDLSALQIKPLDPDGAAVFDDDDDEITVLRVQVEKGSSAGAAAEVFFADVGAEHDIPTSAEVALVTSAVAQTDPGKRRHRNEDRYLELDEHHVYAVADGMGGHAGGHIAADMAVETVRRVFEEQRFDAEVSGAQLPWRADELVKAVQQANLAVYERGREEPWLEQMGTTLVAARFAPRKERVYIAHVGDSRCYRLRDGALSQLTTDHTYGQAGLIEDGAAAHALSRAIGSSPRLTIDVIIAEPRIGDRYLLCSDGLPRMVEEDEICRVLQRAEAIQDGAHQLIRMANDHGGHDNVTVLLVEVCRPAELANQPSASRHRVAG